MDPEIAKYRVYARWCALRVLHVPQRTSSEREILIAALSPYDAGGDQAYEKARTLVNERLGPGIVHLNERCAWLAFSSSLNAVSGRAQDALSHADRAGPHAVMALGRGWGDESPERLAQIAAWGAIDALSSYLDGAGLVALRTDAATENPWLAAALYLEMGLPDFEIVADWRDAIERPCTWSTWCDTCRSFIEIDGKSVQPGHRQKVRTHILSRRFVGGHCALEHTV